MGIIISSLEWSHIPFKKNNITFMRFLRQENSFQNSVHGWITKYVKKNGHSLTFERLNVNYFIRGNKQSFF